MGRLLHAPHRDRGAGRALLSIPLPQSTSAYRLAWCTLSHEAETGGTNAFRPPSRINTVLRALPQPAYRRILWPGGHLPVGSCPVPAAETLVNGGERRSARSIRGRVRVEESELLAPWPTPTLPYASSCPSPISLRSFSGGCSARGAVCRRASDDHWGKPASWGFGLAHPQAGSLLDQFAGTFFMAVPPVSDGLQAPSTLPAGADEAGGPPFKVLRASGQPPRRPREW